MTTLQYSREFEQWTTYTPNPKYAVSTFGNVINKRTGEPAGSKLCPYRWINSCAGVNVYRMVATQFLINDDPEHKTEIDHISDEVDISEFNCVWNLQWITPSANRLKRKMDGTAVRQVRPGQKRWEQTPWHCDVCDRTYTNSYRLSHLKRNRHISNLV